MKTELIVHEQRCKGCGFCIITCPKKAISLSEDFNESSYQYAVVDRALCVKCGSCYTVCPDGVFEILEVEE